MTEQRRDELAAAYGAAFDAWLDAVGDLDDASWSTPTGCPGWDVQDQLSHVVSLERRMLGDPDRPASVPDDVPYVRHEFGRFVEFGVRARRGVAPADLLEEAKDTFERRKQQLRDLPVAYLDEEIDPPVPIPKMRGAQLLRTRIYDVTTHEFDVRRAVGRHDTPGGPHLAISIELILRTWGRLLPNLVDASGVVTIAVDDADQVRLDLGDGTLHRGSDGPAADATLDLAASQLLAIAGGRADAPPVDGLKVQGDTELVRAVLSAGAITP